ncbi:hypothetical protein [Nonomuraea aridisoli]|uniref:Resolvase/invertase-type recombinase catalytic domain-containing protein n=1 Tax=Nonomuraea aridisoli TaxID=2070368 RepID=A0A2W2DGF4_9ACTN|nr:hypothetical protein [Nonomuraea aridisoli]PZG03019.1 hypothetical protein C1J01_46850 [Nonomuraea aridisoli]
MEDGTLWTTLTEQREVDGPIVYGYLRLDRSSHERLAALTVTLAQYCDQHELQLCGIFTDRGRGSVNDRAFVGLLNLLTVSDAYGVVLPTSHHLGGRRIADQRRERIDALGARLLYVRDSRRTAPPALRSIQAWPLASSRR